MECNVYNREDYGGFWRRSFADFFDGIFLAIAYAVGFAIWAPVPIAVLLVFLAYMIGFKVYGGATPGYRILGMRIVSINGTEITVKQALVRTLSSIFSGLAFGLGFIWIAIDENKQAWHDKAAGTYVIRSGANPVRTVEIPQTRLIRRKLFAVLFLGIFVYGSFSKALFKVESHQQAVVLEFGEPKRSVPPGLHLKNPFTQQVRYFDMRVQELHLPTIEAQMSDLTRISIDATASYQIVDCVHFYHYSQHFHEEFGRTLISTLREILGLTWDRVNMREGYIELRPEDTKSRKPRRIYFNQAVRDVFNHALKVPSISHNYVFSYKGMPIKSLRRAFESACRRAGIKDFVFHDLRHTFKTNMRKAGVHQLVIKAIVWGLRKPKDMLEWYDTVDDWDLKEAMERLDGYLAQQKNAPILTPKSLQS